MNDGIFVLVDGRMKVLRRTSPGDEALLPMLLEQHPEIIAAACTDARRRPLLVRRRTGANGVSAGRTGALYVDGEGVPILVETQPHTENISGDDALARLLDCVATGGPDWQGWRMREVFALTHIGRNDTDLLTETLGWRGDPDVFWAQVESNLAAHRVRLVLVAPCLGEGALHVIGFLNEQMRDVEVFGVEVSVYGSGATRAFVPRVVARPPAERHPHDGAATGGKHRLPG